MKKGSSNDQHSLLDLTNTNNFYTTKADRKNPHVYVPFQFFYGRLNILI